VLKSPYFAEFKRNLWLEFSKERLIILGIVSLLAFLITKALLADVPQSETEDVLATPLIIGLFISLLLGSSRVVDSVRDEINTHTWDFQKLSALPPLSLLLGKVFGSASFVIFTTFVFYILGLTLLVMRLEIPVPVANTGTTEYHYWSSLVTVLTNKYIIQYYQFGLIGFLTLTLAYLASFAATIQMAQNSRNKRKFGDASLKGCALFIGTIALVSSFTVSGSYKTYEWYHFELNGPELTLFLLSFGILWSLYAGRQCIRRELQFPVTPFAMVLFALTSLYLRCGFLHDNNFSQMNIYSQQTMYASTSYSYLLTISAFICLAENVTLTKYRKTWKNFKNGNISAAWETTPRWAPLFILTLISFIIYLSYRAVHTGDFSIPPYDHISFLFFIMRDICVWHILNFKRPNKPNHIIFIFYFAICYGALPYILGAQTNDPQLLYIFYPPLEVLSPYKAAQISSLLPPIAQFALTFGYLVHFLQTKARQKTQDCG
jgi:hypothetical protein